MTFQKDINAYLNEELDDDELNAFLQHLSSCPKCYEELEINYIVIEGVGILDENRHDYNLSHAYKESIRRDERYIRLKKALLFLEYIVETAAFWAFLFLTLIYVRMLL